jgi:threonine 3-dehydrogenase
MMYLTDCVEGTLKFLEAPSSSLPKRTYNVTATSFTPEELALAIRKRVPNFRIEYTKEVDRRQAIADSWPDSLDDSTARRDWGWNPKYGMEDMVDIMLHSLKEQRATKV